MFCKNCGKEISNETKFCPSCGQPVSSAPADATASSADATDSHADTVASSADAMESPADTTVSQADSMESPADATASSADAMESPADAAASPADAMASEPNQGTASAYDFASSSDYMQPAYSAPDTQSSMMMPKKNGKKIAAIVAAIIVVALVAVGATAHAQIANFVKRTFSSPESYYNYVEKKNLKTGRKNLVENYKKYEETVNGKDSSKSANYKLELGSSAKTMLSMIGIDFSAFESAEISTVAQVKDKTTTNQTKILLNGNDAVTANVYADMDAKEYYLQIPELSDAYLNLSSMFQSSENNETAKIQDIMFSIGEYIPTSEQMESLYTTYTNLVVDKLTKVEKSTDTLEADGVSQKCTVLKVTITGKEFYDIAKNLLDTLKKDKDLKNIIEKIDKKAEGANIYENFQSALDELAADLESDKDTMESSEGNIVMDVFVNNSGDIVGRMITFTSADGESFNIVSHTPESGSKFGYEMSVTFDGTTYFTITGNGTRKGGKMSGEFSVSLDESLNPSTAVITSMQDIVTIKVDGLDEDKLEDGYLNGTITLQCNAIAAMSTYALEIKASADKKQSTFAMSVLCADDNLATISMEIKDAKAPSIEKPKDDDTVYDITSDSDMETFANSVDLEAFLQDIQTKSGIDFSSYLDMIKSLTGDSGYGSESDYDFGSDDSFGSDSGFGSDDGIGSDSGFGSDNTDDSFGQDGFNTDDFNFDDYTPEEDNTLPDNEL